jgi:hypothetical protein
MKKTAIATALLLATGAANAVSVATGGSFDMYSQQGLDQATLDPITSATPINVDGTIDGFVDEAAGTWGVSSTTPFNGLIWTASNGQILTTPGDYALCTGCGSISPAIPDTVGIADGQIHFTINPGEAAGIIDFAWGGTTGIKVVDIWQINSDGSLTAKRVPGMENGPFPGFNAAFQLTGPGLLTPIPIPAAVWLFGTGLLGLVGVARRKKAA